MYKLLDKQENRIKQQHFVCIFLQNEIYYEKALFPTRVGEGK